MDNIEKCKIFLISIVLISILVAGVWYMFFFNHISLQGEIVLLDHPRLEENTYGKVIGISDGQETYYLRFNGSFKNNGDVGSTVVVEGDISIETSWDGEEAYKIIDVESYDEI